MKKVILSILVGSTLVLASCGGSGYTTDKEAVVEGYENLQKDDAQAHYDAMLEIHKSWIEDRNEIVKEMEGKTYMEKEAKLLEKAAKDDEAKGTLEDLRNRQYDFESDLGDQRRSWGEKTWGLETAISDQKQMLKDKELEAFNKSIDKVQEELGKIREKYTEDMQKLYEEK